MEVESSSAALIGSERRSEPDLDEVDRIIEKRARNKTPKETANERAAIWKASEETYKGENREARRYLWITHYLTLARNLRARADRFEEKADALRVL